MVELVGERREVCRVGGRVGVCAERLGELALLVAQGLHACVVALDALLAYVGVELCVLECLQVAVDLAFEVLDVGAHAGELLLVLGAVGAGPQ